MNNNNWISKRGAEVLKNRKERYEEVSKKIAYEKLQEACFNLIEVLEFCEKPEITIKKATSTDDIEREPNPNLVLVPMSAVPISEESSINKYREALGKMNFLIRDMRFEDIKEALCLIGSIRGFEYKDEGNQIKIWILE